MSLRSTLEDDISAAFRRACGEHDWEAAEFLFQALESMAKRHGDEVRTEQAYLGLVEQGTADSQLGPRR